LRLDDFLKNYFGVFWDLMSDFYVFLDENILKYKFLEKKGLFLIFLAIKVVARF
jgi:hypothetical protein